LGIIAALKNRKPARVRYSDGKRGRYYYLQMYKNFFKFVDRVLLVLLGQVDFAGGGGADCWILQKCPFTFY
jgi:hypothetical protein